MGDPTTDFSQRVAYVRGEYLPLGQAGVPLTDHGFTRSDVTYDVVSVGQGGFFRIDDHLERFAQSLKGYRMSVAETLP